MDAELAFVRRAAAVALALALGCGARGAPSTPAGRIAQAARDAGFRGALLVARRGEVIARSAYGPADEAAGISNTPTTQFRIGSVTKQFVAAAILLRRDRGELRVEDSVCQHLAPCPDAWRPITLRHLLTHTSGIPDYTNLAGFPSVIGTPATTAGLLGRFRDLPLDAQPGDHWHYSNSGYVVLGAVLEQATGLTWDEVLRREIFTPLGMASTQLAPDAPPLLDSASGYLAPGVRPVHLASTEFAAAGGLASTVDDLFAWDEALRAGRVLSAASLAEATTAQVPCPPGAALGEHLGYGYGWFSAQFDGHAFAYHWGRIDGFVSSNGFGAADGTVVVLLSNLETSNTFGLSATLERIVALSP